MGTIHSFDTDKKEKNSIDNIRLSLDNIRESLEDTNSSLEDIDESLSDAVESINKASLAISNAANAINLMVKITYDGQKKDNKFVESSTKDDHLNDKSNKQIDDQLEKTQNNK